MLEKFFQMFGFFGALFVALLCFAVFIFWIAGIAGIADLPESRKKDIQLIVCILFPPYPFFWVLYDINRERKLMKE
jgi:uncharacterized BrkB/YihY/UPF0761 family membrane protein